MAVWQHILLIGLGMVGIVTFVMGLYKSWSKQQAFQQMSYLGVLGIFVWGDAVVLGPFWLFVAGLSLILQDFILFMLVSSLFWFIRSIGEMVYWFNQQFSQLNRNPPERLKGYRFFQNDAVWVVYQVGWQCVAVLSLVSTIYFAVLWVRQIY